MAGNARRPPDRPPGRGPVRISRRKALAWLSSLPWAVGALQGCGGPSEDALDDEILLPELEGEIVGPSREAGHRLRVGDLPRTPGREVETEVLIAGGGVAGLTAGWRLVRAGFDDFKILELEPAAGGKSRWGKNDVSAFPWGAHYLPMPTDESVVVHRLLDEMGMVVGRRDDGSPIYDPRHLCHSPQERLFVGNRWQPGLSLRSVTGPEDAADVAQFEARIEEYRAFRDGEGRRAFALPMERSSRARELLALDEISMAEDLDRAGWTSERLRWYVDYCCRDDYGCGLDSTSAWAGWHYFCAREPDAEVLTWPEGNGRLVRHLAETVGDRLHTGRLVYGARRRDDGVEVDVLDLATDEAVRYRCRRLIYALPRFTAPYVIEGAERLPLTYSPWLVANLTVERPPEHAAWDNVLYESRSLGYVVATHQNLSVAPGPSVLTYYLPFIDRDPAAARLRLQEATWDELSAIVLGDLALAHPEIVAQTRRLDLMVWGHAMIRPVPGAVWGEARRRAGKPLGPIHFAHSDMSALSLFEEASYRGANAAETVLAELGRPAGPLA